MKNLPLVLLTLTFAGLFAWKYSEVEKLHQRLDALEAKAAAAPMQASKTESAAAKTESAKADGITKSADVAETAESAKPKDPNPMAKISKAFESMMKSDGAKEAMKQGSKGVIEAMFKDLFDLLELDPETKKAFLAALSDAQVEQQALGMKMFTAGNMTAEEKAALAKELKDNHTAMEEKIKGILGTDEKFAQFKQYQDSTPERQQITSLKDKFSAAGAPMDDSLEQKVMDVMYSERKNMKWDYDYTDQQDIRPEKFTDQSIARFEEQNKEYDRRMEARLQGTLNESQLEAFRTQRQQQHAMESMGLNFAKAIFGSEGK